MSPGDWQKLRSTRDQVLQGNPDLQAEYKQILKKMDGQQASLDAAMIKIDPSMAPLIAQFQNDRKVAASPAPIPPTPVK